MLDRHLHNSRPFQLGFLVIVSSSWKLLDDCGDGDVRHTLSSTLEFCSVFCTTLVQSHKHLRGTSIDGCLASAVTTSATTFKYVQIWSLDTWETWSGGHSLTARCHSSPSDAGSRKGHSCVEIGRCATGLTELEQQLSEETTALLRVVRLINQPRSFHLAASNSWWGLSYGRTLSLNLRGDRRHWFECVNFNYRSNLGQLKRYRGECRFSSAVLCRK